MIPHRFRGPHGGAHPLRDLLRQIMQLGGKTMQIEMAPAIGLNQRQNLPRQCSASKQQHLAAAMAQRRLARERITALDAGGLPGAAAGRRGENLDHGGS